MPRHAPAGLSRRGLFFAAVPAVAGLTGLVAVLSLGRGPASPGGPGDGPAATTVAPAERSAADAGTVATDDRDDATDTAASGPTGVAVAEVRRRLDGPVVERLAAAGIGVPVPPIRNELGQPVALDETALLACAHNATAAVLLDEGRPAQAGDELARAAARAMVSAVAEVAGEGRALLQALGGSDPGPAVGELARLCDGGGFRR